jgi:transposase
VRNVNHRGWQARRATLLQLACNSVAEQVQSGSGIGKAIQATARKFRGRSLGGSRRLRLSAGTLQRIWGSSNQGTNLAAFNLHYRGSPALFLSPNEWEQVSVRMRAGACYSYRQAALAVRFSVASGIALRRWLRSQKALTMRKRHKRGGPGKISQLSVAQRDQIQRWFEDNLIYREISSRILSEFGQRISVPSLCEHYKAIYGKDKLKPTIKGKITRLLSEAQRERLDSWLSENITYSEVAARVTGEFGVSIGKADLSDYYSRCLTTDRRKRKPRPGKINGLAITQREQLHDWLRRRNELRWEDIRLMVLRDFGTPVTGASLSSYCAHHYEEIFGASCTK